VGDEPLWRGVNVRERKVKIDGRVPVTADLSVSRAPGNNQLLNELRRTTSSSMACATFGNLFEIDMNYAFPRDFVIREINSARRIKTHFATRPPSLPPRWALSLASYPRRCVRRPRPLAEFDSGGISFDLRRIK